MAEVRPFLGLHYNKSLLKDWQSLLCPPYDIIPPERQQELYLRSEYNFVRLELGRELSQDNATDNKYSRSAAILGKWLKEDVLEVDEIPAIYLHDQYFTHQGRQYKRRGITVRVKLEEWDRMVVRPHEGVMVEPRSDRLNLLWALQANTSPILALFEDTGRQLSLLLATEERGKPLLDLEGTDGEGHKVWAITDPRVVSEIVSRLATKPLYIADGHHRYESALIHQRERRARSSLSSESEAFNYVMMTLVDFSNPGLIILPPHRLIRGLSQPTLTSLMAKLEAFFEIEEIPLSMPDIRKQTELLLADGAGVKFLLFGLLIDRLLLLKLRGLDVTSQMMPYFHSEIYKKLDVSVVDHIVLEKLLTLSSDEEKASLAYTYDALDAVNLVSNQDYQLAFLLRPPRVETIKAIADASDRMPRKSTYFYPKLPAGLLFNRLV